ncbi:hypothetical protein [Streptomyces triculaminicus]|uniref:hypothetical protein n=1 Tax=Streptomyces triculaminicus TaxID=2816232 RepID=UPI0037AE1E73
MEVSPEQEARALEQMFNSWVAQSQNGLRLLQESTMRLEQKLASGAVEADEVFGVHGETYAQELSLCRQWLVEEAAELRTVVEGGVANFKNFLVNGSEYMAQVVAEEIHDIVHGIDPAKYGALGAASRIASAAPAPAGAPTAVPGAAAGEGAALGEGAAVGETAAAGEGVAAGEGLAATGEGVAASGALTGEAAAAGGAAVGEAVGGGAAATEAAGSLAGIGLGPLVIGGLVILGLVGGGIYLWNRTHSQAPAPPPTHVSGPQQPGAPNAPNPAAPGPSNPTAPQPGPAAPFDINGTYNGTLNGAVCTSPECFITLAKESDATGPGQGQEGHIHILFTAVNYTPAFTGVASRINETIGPMAASLTQDGMVQGSGTTTETDTSPGGDGATAMGRYAVSGNIKDATTGSPSYVLHLTLDGALYDFTGAR